MKKSRKNAARLDRRVRDYRERNKGASNGSTKCPGSQDGRK